ncbi:MAG: hypothetical protein KGL11_05825 [Alphaproteobacteria bacterium]|nr:hypothetical protein [Alphaproteobacteria bacterium]
MAIEVSSGGAARRGVRASAALTAGYWALALVPVAALFVLAVLSPPMAMNDYLSDDAYYYLRVAANIARGAGSTYGNLVPTNGYHPLWQLALVPVFWLIRAPDQAIPAVFAIASAAWIACVVLYRRIGQLCDAEAAFLLGGLYLCWLGTFALPGGAGLVFLGMETTLALPLALWLIEWSLSRAIFTAAPQSPRTLLTIGAVLTLLCLARLDAVFIAGATIAAFVLVRRQRGWHASLRDGIVMGAPLAITLLIYMATNQVLFGAAMPVSGAAKALGGPFLNFNPLIASLWGASTLQLRTIPLGLVFVAAPATVLALAWRKTGDRDTDGARTQLLVIAAVLLAGVALHLVYLCVGSSWPIWAWYGYGRALLGAIVVPLALAAVWRRWIAVPMVVAVTVALLALGSGAVVAKRLALGDNRSSYWVHAERDAAQLNAILPADAVVAMGDLAGSLGYRLARPMVQIEGLVEGAEYLRALRQPGGWQSYFRARGVTYIAAADYRLQSCADAVPGCHVIVEPKFGEGPKVRMHVRDTDVVFHDRDLTVWRYRPEIQAPSR